MVKCNFSFVLTCILIFITCSRINATMAYDALAKKFEIFPPIEKSRYIQISQLEQILISIEETYKTMNEKQKQDAISISQATNELQLINQRLQNIENQINQIEQTELFNKHRFELFQDSSMKEEVHFDDIKRKLEKNQQQTNNRLGEIDLSLERVHSTQDVLLKEIRKINAVQNKLLTSVEEMNENPKPEWTKFTQSMNTSQQRFQQELKDLMKNSTNFSNVRSIFQIRETSSRNNISTDPQHTRNDLIITDLITSISNINEKFNNLQEQSKFIQSSMNKCISLGDEIYNDIQLQKRDVDNLLSHTQETIINEIKLRSLEDTDQLDTTFKINFDIILKEQEQFKNDCHRIQIHEERLEEKAVYILEKLFNYIDNKTDGIRYELDRLVQSELKQNSYQTKEIQKLTELMNSQKDISAVHVPVTKKPSYLTTSTGNEIVPKYSTKVNKNMTKSTTSVTPIELDVFKKMAADDERSDYSSET